MDNQKLVALPPGMGSDDYLAHKKDISRPIKDALTRIFRPDAPADRFSRAISRIAEKTVVQPIVDEKINLKLHGKPIDPKLFSDASGLLPLVVWRGEETANYCLEGGSERVAMKVGNGAVYELQEKSILGVKSVFPTIPAVPSAYLCFVNDGAHSLVDYIKEKASMTMSKDADIADFVDGLRSRIEQSLNGLAQSPGVPQQSQTSAAPAAPTGVRIVI